MNKKEKQEAIKRIDGQNQLRKSNRECVPEFLFPELDNLLTAADRIHDQAVDALMWGYEYSPDIGDLIALEKARQSIDVLINQQKIPDYLKD
jgi:hypothetical protein